MASHSKDNDGISRRDFGARLGAAAAGVAVGGELFTPAPTRRHTSATGFSARTIES